MLNLLLDSSASKEIRSVADESALDLAVKNEHLEVVGALLSLGPTGATKPKKVGAVGGNRSRDLTRFPAHKPFDARPVLFTQSFEPSSHGNPRLPSGIANALSGAYDSLHLSAPGDLSVQRYPPSAFNPLLLSDELMNQSSLPIISRPSALLARPRDELEIFEALLPISSDWKKIGFRMRCELSSLENIENKHRDAESCLIDLASLLLRKGDVSWKRVIKAVRNCGHEHQAKVITQRVHESP